jgi:hypothetical protein
MIYAINYDLKQPGRNYSGLYEAIGKCGETWHYLGSTWLVSTSLTAQGIWDRLAPHIDKNDFMLVVGITRDHQGWLPPEAWNWINTRQARLAA